MSQKPLSDQQDLLLFDFEDLEHPCNGYDFSPSLLFFVLSDDDIDLGDEHDS